MQFDSAETPPNKFRERFKKALHLVQDNWPELRVEVFPDGLKVYPCRKSLESKQRATKGIPMPKSPAQPTKTDVKPNGNPF